GRLGHCSLLIDGGADVSGTDKYGRTPLYVAAKNGRKVVVQLLIDRGADISAADKYAR
ncbi:hypothetical protein FN846DRAFT_754518, partial [Sphaerosporella brunnea]